MTKSSAHLRSADAAIELAGRYLQAQKLIEPNDNVVIISDLRAGAALVDCVQLRQVKA